MTKREPLIIRAAIVAAITGIIHALVVMGVLTIDAAQETAFIGAIDLAATAVIVLWSRGAVTPVADPRLPNPPGAGRDRADA